MAWLTAAPYTDQSNGVTHPAGAYFKIQATKFDHKAQTATIHCDLYASKDARNAGLNPILSVDVQYISPSTPGANDPNAQFPQICGFPATPQATNPDNLVAQIYAALLSHPQVDDLLSGATAG